MNNRQAYNKWAETYDDVSNKTRDIEAVAFRKVLGNSKYKKVLELGCGTGKNTEWLINQTDDLTCVDFSEKMLKKAQEKMKSGNVKFIKSDIEKKWHITKPKYDLVTCSLILEHIKDLDFIFSQANNVLKSGGLFYIGELHPKKQHLGSKAKFNDGKKILELDCYTHNISDFFYYSRKHKLHFIESKDWFDEDNPAVPRVITLIFQKKYY